MSHVEVWTRALNALREEGRDYALTWLERLTPVGIRGETLVLVVEDRFLRAWIDDHYRSLIEGILAKLPDSPSEVVFEGREEEMVATPEEADAFSTCLATSNLALTLLGSGVLARWAEEDVSPAALALAIAHLGQLDALEAQFPGVKAEAARLYEPTQFAALKEKLGVTES